MFGAMVGSQLISQWIKTINVMVVVVLTGFTFTNALSASSILHFFFACLPVGKMQGNEHIAIFCLASSDKIRRVKI